MPQPQGSSPKRIVVAGEDRTHRFLVARLFERVRAHMGAGVAAPWLFTGLHARTDFYDTRHAKEDAKKAGIRTSGRVRGRLRSPESLLFVRVWALAELRGADALVMLADSDNEAEFIRDARAIQQQLTGVDPAMALGVCHRDAEGWLLAGYTPATEDEAARLRAAGKQLSFNPVREPERLTAQPNDADTDAKRVCVYILGDGGALAGKNRAASRAPSEVELEAMTAGLAPISVLATFRECGVAEFIAALEKLCGELFPTVAPA